MSDSSPSLLSLDEPALEAATTPPPPPQPGEHSMRLRSQGPEPHRSTLDAHLRGHIHTDLAEGEIPTVQTPRRILHGPATPFSDSVGTHSTSRSTSPDGSAATRSAGGRTSPEPVLPTTALPAPDDDAATQLDFEFGATPLVVTPLAGRDNAHPAARSPVLGSGGLDIDALPDLEEPNALAAAIAWRSTFVKHAGVDVTPAVRAKAIADEANQRKAATLRHRLRLLLSDGVAENDAAARAAESAALAPAARTTVMATFAAAVDDLPDLVDPVDSFVWRETFMKHARHADTALAEFNRELDTRFGPADALRVSCADLKALCAENSSALASLITLMGQTHARVSTLEAATAKNEADFATTKTALAATVAAQVTTAAAVAGFSSTVNDAVVDHVGRHFGPLRSDVTSLGQELVALRNLMENMHGDPPPPAAPHPGAPVADDTVLSLESPADDAPQSTPAPPGVTTGNSGPDMPPPAVPGMLLPASKLFPNVDSTNLRVDTTHRARFGAQRFPAEGRHDDDEPPYEGGRWAPGHSPRAPTPACLYPVNTYRPSRPQFQDSRPHAPQMPGDETTTFVGGAISSPRNLDRRRQAATARVSQFDIAALADAQYHGGSEGYCPLTPALIHRCGYTAINTVDVISSYNKIVLVHESVITNWVGRFTVGPQIDRIPEKALVSLPRLQSLAVESAVEWYDAL